MSDRTDVCLECWRDFTQDFLHLDCTGEVVVSRVEADELRAWVTGRHAFAISTGQVTCKDHEFIESGFVYTCPHCGATV